MNKSRLDGLYLFLLGSLVLVLLGSVLSNGSAVAMVDFRVVYYPARCLIQHCDPYNESAVLEVANAEGGTRPGDATHANHFARYLYLPTAFFLTVPFALLPWGLAHTLWMGLIAGGLILAAFLMWDLGADSSPVICGALIGFFLANCELLIVLGNMAGIAISLCIVAVWCFFRERFVVAGILCLAISLATKPHDSGMVWLYFLLAGGIYRRRALQTLMATVTLSLPGLVWTWMVSPHWIEELHSNILAFAERGGLTDPQQASAGWHGLGMMINLQTVVSAFWNDPSIYNPLTYLICAPPILVWVFVTLKTRPSKARAALAIASIAPLSMLPFYHHQYDAKLLLLTVPACVLLWSERGNAGRLALVLNGTAFILIGDISWLAILGIINKLFPPGNGFGSQILVNAQVFSAPLILLMLGVFYLWVYVSRSLASDLPLPIDSSQTAPNQVTS